MDVDLIKIGPYPLRRPLSGRIEYTFIYELNVDQLSPPYCGHGCTPEAAEFDLQRQLCNDFERLYHKRPFQMTQNERKRWKILENAINVDQCHNVLCRVTLGSGVPSHLMTPSEAQAYWDSISPV